MAIEFHCVHCGHKVRAAEEHAGKRGKCPSCKQSVYIPTPSEQIEPLELAPLDEAERQRQRKLEEESRRVVQRIREDQSEPPAETRREPLPEPVGDARLAVDVETLVFEYVLCMAEGKLNEAEELAAEIRSHRTQAAEVIQRLTVDELPPTRLAHIPRGALLGFLKQLQKS